jgi:peptide-methionine (S)-S-oxide reductase
MLFRRTPEMVDADRALPGRHTPMVVPARHESLGTSLEGPYPEGMDVAYFALGCFWGAERLFFETPGVYSTAVGYQGGMTPNPTYEEVCSGMTGHAEAVKVVFDPTKVSYAQLLSIFFEGHDPTQGYRQGNDIGTQYRSAIFATSNEQLEMARQAAAAFNEQLAQRGLGTVTTEIEPAGPFYYAEDYHQQYLVKVPNGYCGLGGTGVSCPVGLFANER